MPGEEELVLEVGGHGAELAVDEVEREAEIFGADAHKSLHDIHLFFASAAGDDVGVEACHERTIGIVGAVEIFDDGLTVHSESREDERRAPSGSVLALETMPEHTPVGRLDDDAKKGGVLKLGVFAAD